MPPHGNRSKRPDNPWRNPKPAEIRAARDAAGLTQTQAAKLVYSTLSAWQRWENPEESPDHRAMHPAFWALFRLRLRLIGLKDL